MRVERLDDERLAALVARGEAGAFETLYDRHHAALLAFCRHMLGNREDGEDALQQTFLRAHRALAAGRAPDAVRPWLFAIARNRCRTMLAARREAAVAVEDVEPSFEGLSADVERRADLRELVTDLARLPDDQRGALVLAELGDFSHVEIAQVIGCSAPKVKALVFQARTSLIADRDARRTPCDEIRTSLETARGGVLRRAALRRHLRLCDPCAAYRLAMEGRRSGLAAVLPVAPTAGLKAAVLAGFGGFGGGAETAAAAAALLAPGSVGAAGGGAAAGGVAVKALAAKAAVALIVGVGAVGGGAAVHELAHDAPVTAASVEQTAQRAPGAQAPRAPRQRAAQPPPATALAPIARTQDGSRLRRSRARAHARPLARRVRRAVARHLRRHATRRARAVARRRIRRHRIRTGTAVGQRSVPRVQAKTGPVAGDARPERRRRRRRADPAPAPAPTATPTPAATPEPVPTPPTRPHRRKRPVATPVPAPAPTAEPSPSPEPTAEPTPSPTP